MPSIAVAEALAHALELAADKRTRLLAKAVRAGRSSPRRAEDQDLRCAYPNPGGSGETGAPSAHATRVAAFSTSAASFAPASGPDDHT